MTESVWNKRTLERQLRHIYKKEPARIDEKWETARKDTSGRDLQRSLLCTHKLSQRNLGSKIRQK